jgi:hypothetical protein
VEEATEKTVGFEVRYESDLKAQEKRRGTRSVLARGDLEIDSGRSEEV